MNLYTFRLDQFRIDDTRALHNDTDVVAISLNVGDRAFTLTKQMGDVNNGNHDVGLEFTSIRIDDPNTKITLNFAITNSGHDATKVEEALKTGLDKLGMAGGTALGLPGPAVAAIMTAVDVALAALFADCDGAVAADNQSDLISAFDKLIPANGRVFTHTKSYPGTDSATGCGSNSRYNVTLTLIRIQVPDHLVVAHESDNVNHPDPTKKFIILSRSSGLVLDVTNASNAAGAKIQQYPDAGTENQHWRTVPVDGGFFKIQGAASGMVLEVVGDSHDDKAQIQQSWDNGATTQHWQFIPVSVPPTDLPFPVLTAGGLFFKIKSRVSGKVLDVPEHSANQSIIIQQFSDTGGSNQLWQLISAGDVRLGATTQDGGGTDGGPIIQIVRGQRQTL
jgi:hypothetical protein